MKILLSMENFYSAIGGAELSIKKMVEMLGKDHKVEILCSGKKNKDIQGENVIVHVRKIKKKLGPGWLPESIPELEWLNLLHNQNQWRVILKYFIKDNRPDIILTQLNFSPPTIDIALSENIPTILFIRSYEHFCPVGFLKKDPFVCNRSCWHCISPFSKIQYPVIKALLNRHKKALMRADLVLANSTYVNKVVRRFYNIHVDVLYPLIDLKKYKTEIMDKKYLLFVGGSEHKGIKFLLKIANKMMDKEFLLVGKTDKALQEEIKKYRNLKHVTWIDDMREIYSQTKLLIMPRMWPEPFGRIVIEAGINGIPTISSNIGGLSESVGRGGTLINKYHDVNEWIKEIKKIIDDKVSYDALSANAKKHAKKFDADKVYMDFKRIVKAKLGINL